MSDLNSDRSFVSAAVATVVAVAVVIYNRKSGYAKKMYIHPIYCILFLFLKKNCLETVI